MKRSLSFFAATLATLIAFPAIAAENDFKGQGFDCFFQTEKQKLDHFTLWYGGIRYENDKLPQVQDAARLFALNGFTAGNEMSFYVRDQWPDKFEVQYFQRSVGPTPLSVLTIYGVDEGQEAYRAEIVHLPPDLTAGSSVQPTKRLGGMCSSQIAVTLQAFQASAQS